MKQISIQITDITARQMAVLAEHWGLPPQRHNTAVVERAVATIHLLEIGYETYQARLKQLTTEPVPAHRAALPAEVQALEAQLPELLRILENGLRAGYSLVQALGMAASDLGEPTGPFTQTLVDQISGGIPLPVALANWQSQLASTDLDLLCATVRLQLITGGNLADKFSLLNQILGQRCRP